MLRKIYIGVGAAVCLWFMTAAIAGWKSPKFFSAGGRSGSGRGGGVFFGGGGWGGK